jgi:RNA polymerase sigma-70 factor (ECF subfamily)
MKDMQVLIEPLIPGLRRYARALVRDRTLADDLVQDCIERAIRRWRQKRPDGDTRTYVARRNTLTSAISAPLRSGSRRSAMARTRACRAFLAGYRATAG